MIERKGEENGLPCTRKRDESPRRRGDQASISGAVQEKGGEGGGEA